MNKLFKTLALGILMAAFAVISAETTYAQCDDAEGKRTLYNKFIENYDKNEAQQKVALEAGKEYISKYGSCEADKEQIAYLRDTGIPYVEGSLKKYQDDRNAQAALDAKNALYARFDAAAKAENVDEIFASGKQILSSEPDFLDIHLVMATAGYDQAMAKNNKYNNEAIEHARKAIQLLEAGKPSTSGAYGAYGYSYKTKEFSTPEQAKNNALGWMNYNIGFIMFYNQDKKKEALPFLYRATQVESGVKKYSDPYRMIGEYFTTEVARLDKERFAKIAANNNQDNEETLQVYALEKAYADRAIDAFARAYKIATNTPTATKEYKDSLYNQLKELYNFRHNNTTGLDAYVASVMNRPMPNPTTEIKPVVEDATTTTTSNTTTAPSTNVSNQAATTPATKPAVTSKSNAAAPADKAKTNASTKPANQKTTPQRKRQR